MPRLIRQHRMLTVLVGVVPPGVLTALLQFLFDSEIPGLTAIYCSLAGGVFAGALVIIADSLDPAKSTGTLGASIASIVQQPAPHSYGRIFSRRTPEELVEEISGITSLVAKRLVDRHRGQWLRVNGVVRDVEETAGCGTVVLDRSDSQPAVRLEFDLDSHGAILGSLNVGDEFASIGKIEDVQQSMVFLGSCELDGN